MVQFAVVVVAAAAGAAAANVRDATEVVVLGIPPKVLLPKQVVVVP